MIETEEQRRWWFATHPEYSWSRRGIRTHAYKEKDKDSEKVDPEEVDAYVDEMLNYATGPVADLLKSAKRNFGTESLHPDHDSHSRKPATDGRTHDLTKLHEALERDKVGLVRDPHTLLDLLPCRRLITAPISVIRSALKNLAGNAVLNAIKKDGRRRPPRLPAKGTRERKEIEDARKRGIKAKQAEERADIMAGGRGSGVWTEKELQEIRQGGDFPDDVRWHHDPTVANRPDLASNPKVVRPLRGGNKGHLRDGHEGNYQNPRE